MATLDTILTAYETNADYDEVADVAKAKAFRTACRRILAKQPTEAFKGGGGAVVKMNPDLVRQQLEAVEAWLVRHPSDSELETDPTVIHPDFANFRY